MIRNEALLVSYLEWHLHCPSWPPHFSLGHQYSPYPLICQSLAFPATPFTKFWAYWIVGCMGVCTGKTNRNSDRRKEEKVPVLVNACGEARGQTWTYPRKALCPIYFLFTFVDCWPSSNLGLKASTLLWGIAENGWLLVGSISWKPRSAPCFWWHLAISPYYCI